LPSRYGSTVPATLTIRNVPNDLEQRLKERARRNHRSLQGELMAIVEQAVTADHKATIEEVADWVLNSGVKTPAEAVRMIREDRDR
jgi:plasmid stability protein